jgi:hypothetical protein
LQPLDSERAGQVMPLELAAVMMERVRACVPLPHDLEQEPYSVQLETMQCTGQACIWQVVEPEREGHATPPWATSWVIYREWVATPPPQEWEQVVHSPHSETTQLVGQWKSLHTCDSSEGQELPDPFSPLSGPLTTVTGLV